MEMLAATNTEAEDQELTLDPCRGTLVWESQQLFRLEDTPRPGWKIGAEAIAKKKKEEEERKRQVYRLSSCASTTRGFRAQQWNRCDKDRETKNSLVDTKKGGGYHLTSAWKIIRKGRIT